MSPKKFPPIEEIVLATTNPGKLAELKELLRGSGFKALRSLGDFPPTKPIKEVGNTFFENALLKAKGAFVRIKKPVLAEDSGLVVDALNGEPGVRSARYAGEGGTAEDCLQKVLKNLQPYPNMEARKAHYHATCVLYWEVSGEGFYLSSEGKVLGTIATEPIGTEGFGYDPIFVPEGFLGPPPKTFGLLGKKVKQQMSHRALAVKGLLEQIKPLRGRS